MKLPQNFAGLILRIGLFTTCALAGVQAPTVLASSAQYKQQLGQALDQFDIRKEPTQADWRYFIRAPEAARQALWDHHAKAGQSLSNWTWGWRLGWVRVCGNSKQAYCMRIMQEALFDKALVVRAEAATRFGRRLEGSRDTEAAGLLEKAFANPRNIRAGKPLFVQHRILFALHTIGGQKAQSVGAQLARRHPETEVYWGKLAAVETKVAGARILE